MTDDLVAFCRARLIEVEEVLSKMHGDHCGPWDWISIVERDARFKRQLVDEYVRIRDDARRSAGFRGYDPDLRRVVAWAEDMVKTLAATWSTHPDFQQKFLLPWLAFPLTRKGGDEFE